MYHGNVLSRHPNTESKGEYLNFISQPKNLPYHEKWTTTNTNIKVLDKRISEDRKITAKSVIPHHGVVTMSTTVDTVKRELVRGVVAKPRPHTAVTPSTPNDKPFDSSNIKPKVFTNFVREKPIDKAQPSIKKHSGISSWNDTPGTPSDICAYVGNLDK